MVLFHVMVLNVDGAFLFLGGAGCLFITFASADAVTGFVGFVLPVRPLPRVFASVSISEVAEGVEARELLLARGVFLALDISRTLLRRGLRRGLRFVFLAIGGPFEPTSGGVILRERAASGGGKGTADLRVEIIGLGEKREGERGALARETEAGTWERKQ